MTQQPSPSDPHFWQARYEAGEAHWDKGAAAPPLLEYLESQPVAGRVLVPGCGSGHDVRTLAAQGAEVVGMDFAPGAIAAANTHPNHENTQFVLGDFLNLDPKFYGTFDWIFEHTCFCAIDPKRRPDYLRSCLQALKPRGKLLAVFYINPDQDEPDHPPFRSSPEELDQWFLPHFEILHQQVPTQSYEGREGRELLRVFQRKEA
ncbi:MAG: methyltransferase domain-containing protein [Terrimicrobiaceae bacterium]